MENDDRRRMAEELKRIKAYLYDIKCPVCGTPMDADIHAPEDGCYWDYPHDYVDKQRTAEEMRAWDNWICPRCVEHNDEGGIYGREDYYIKILIDIFEGRYHAEPEEIEGS